MIRILVWMTSSLLLAVPVYGEPITVSAAVSMKESLTQIGNAYQASGGDPLTFNFDASGKLAAQIKEGAPVDVFISADDEQMDKLAAAQKINTATRRIVVNNTLVLIASTDEKKPPKNFKDLSEQQDRKIAIGEPRTVPAGHYAMQVLKNLQLDQTLAPRLVLGESVRQVLTYVKQDEVWAGIVYATDAKQAGQTVKVIAVADPAMHDTIEYPAAVVAGSPHSVAAGKFIDYLMTDPAKAIFISHGFSIASPAPTSRPSP